MTVNQQVTVNDPQFFSRRYSQLSSHYDKKYKTAWYYMHATPRPCFTHQLLSEIDQFQRRVKQKMLSSQQQYCDFLVLASDVPGVFNLGGDLSLFSDLIKRMDKEHLMKYALKCINVLYRNITHLNSDLTTISLVKGKALGGGFEAALSSNVVVAEKGTKLGLPEVLFNLFPGMGAYSLLSRRVNKHKAENIILSGKLYQAEELYDLGVIDILAEVGQGEKAVYHYIKQANSKPNSYRTIRKIRDFDNDISYRELENITETWVDAALNLREKDLKMMARLATRQTQLHQA